MSNGLTSEEKNAERMLSSLRKLGIDDINLDGVRAILRNKPDPSKMDRWTMRDDDKLRLQIKFHKSFAIDHFVVTFVPRLPVDHDSINGVDTKALEEKMKSADWYYASESSAQLEYEYSKIEKIQLDINQLVKTREGLHTATILWNNNVPFYTVRKPQEIRDYEISGELYAAQKFDGGTDIDEAHKVLAAASELKHPKEQSVGLIDSTSQDFPVVSAPGNRPEIIVTDSETAAIRDLLKEQMSDGKNWVVVDEGASVIGQHHLNFFETEYDAAEFIFENTTDRDFFMDIPIADFQVQLDKWEKLRSNPEQLIDLLENKMKHADWSYKNSNEYDRYYEGEKKMGQINFLLQLVKNDVGIAKANVLWDRYASQTGLSKPDFLTEKNTVMMTEQELSRNRREFGLIGAGSAFNEDVIKQMKAGVAKIEYNYPTKNPVTGDEAETTFYLDKSDRSNLYFLNKWDVSVKKFGTEPPVKMTFYNNDLERVGRFLKKDPNKLVTTYTHARSINRACGRALFNTYKNLAGRIEKIWDQAYPNEILSNGKMKERQFHKEYGFNLRAVGNEYRTGIKCLSNPEHAERFYQSLERGNLEKTVFVEKDGTQPKYYVTPNISVGFLEVYPKCSKDAEPLTPEQLAEKCFISPEFALKVRERMNQIEKERHTHKQNNVSENKPEENRTNTKNQKQNENAGKKNKKTEKLNAETVKTKKKLKPKIT